MRLPAAARVRRGADFKLCFAARQRLSGRYFFLQWRANQGPGPRLGLAVSRKVDRRAVGRNRLKRLLRESFRAAAEDLPAFDLVLLARPEAAHVDGARLRADLAALWTRVRALPPPAQEGTMPAASGSPGAQPVTTRPASPT